MMNGFIEQHFAVLISVGTVASMVATAVVMFAAPSDGPCRWDR